MPKKAKDWEFKTMVCPHCDFKFIDVALPVDGMRCPSCEHEMVLYAKEETPTPTEET